MEERQRLAQIIIEDHLATADGITLKVSITPVAIDFDWGGEQADYDEVEAVCNDAGFSFAHIKYDVEQTILKRLKNRGK